AVVVTACGVAAVVAVFTGFDDAVAADRGGGSVAGAVAVVRRTVVGAVVAGFTRGGVDRAIATGRRAAVCVTGSGFAAIVAVFAGFDDAVTTDRGGGSVAGGVAVVGRAVVGAVVAGLTGRRVDDAVAAGCSGAV